MPEYDPQVTGNDYSLTKRDGQIVAMMGWQGLTAKQMALLPEEPLEKFFVQWGEEEVSVFGVTPEDAMEALRRHDSGLSDGIRSGEFRLFRRNKEYIEV